MKCLRIAKRKEVLCNVKPGALLMQKRLCKIPNLGSGQYLKAY